jgi:hypothetical protein
MGSSFSKHDTKQTSESRALITYITSRITSYVTALICAQY